MSLSLPESAENTERTLQKGLVNLDNLWRAFERSGLTTLLLNAFIGNGEAEPKKAEEPLAGLDSLRGAVAHHQELTDLRRQIGAPERRVEGEEPVKKISDYQRIGEGLVLDVANFTTPSAFIAALKAYAKTPDALGRLKTTTYEWGGEGDVKEGVDCSGLIMAALTHQLHLAKGDASAGAMYRHLIKAPKSGSEKASEVRVGDLLFTLRRSTRKVTHVMVIAELLGDGKVRVIESSGRGWSDKRTIDLIHGDSKRQYHFGTPRFYRF